VLCQYHCWLAVWEHDDVSWYVASLPQHALLVRVRTDPVLHLPHHNPHCLLEQTLHVHKFGVLLQLLDVRWICFNLAI
jgi:hypothetical protein